MSPEQIAAQKDRYRIRNSSAPVTSVAVVGLGYVGLPLAILSASRGFNTLGFDIDEVKIAQLERREADFLSPDEAREFRDSHTLSLTARESDLRRAQAFIVCVPTPVSNGHKPDLKPLESAARIVGRNMKRGSLVVIESTVNPGVCEQVVLPILEKASKLDRSDILFAHCPERINPGDERWDVRSIPRVLGARDAESLEAALSLYRTLIDAEIMPMSTIKEAEAVKMVENAFRDINIAFVNELAMSFDRAGIDIVNVIRGASTKPFGFLAHYPGCGVGGHCIPVDPYYLIRYGRENGFEHRFLITARRINDGMPYFTVRLLEKSLREKRKKLSGARIALLGISYKADIPDMRESPALVIRDLLKKEGADVRIFDPYVRHESTARSLTDALEGADAAVLATDHSDFKKLAPQDLLNAGVHVLVDGRNCLDKVAFKGSGVTYRGIGR